MLAFVHLRTQILTLTINFIEMSDHVVNSSGPSVICLCCGIFLPIYCVILYYSFRFIFPAKKWDAFREALCGDNYPYTRVSQFVFENGASPPKPGDKIITSVCPHGILTLGWSYLISSNVYSRSDTKWLVAPAMMKLPFVSDIMHWTSCYSAEPQSMNTIMRSGCNVGLIPGGFQEATLYTRGKHRAYLLKRKGFIKYALKYGYSIQPAYVFGEELTFWSLDLIPKSIAFWLNKYNIPTCIFIGKFLFMPDDDIDFTVYIGNVIKLPHIPNPSKEDVDKHHAMYIQAYRDLFEKNKEKYAAEGKNAILEIL